MSRPGLAMRAALGQHKVGWSCARRSACVWRLVMDSSQGGNGLVGQLFSEL